MPVAPQGGDCFPPTQLRSAFSYLVHPEYLTDATIGACPSDSDADLDSWRYNRDPEQPIDPCQLRATSYNYLAWAMNTELYLRPGINENDAIFEGPSFTNALLSGFIPEFIEAFFPLVTEWGNPNADFSVFESEPGIGEYTLYRLREGIERFMITDINNPAASARAQSTIAVMWDDFNPLYPEFMNHIPGGCNALYMDGHVEFIRYPGRSPISKAFGAILGAANE